MNKILYKFNKVIKIVFFKNFISRVEIAQMLNMSRASITNITKVLLNKKIINEIFSILDLEKTEQKSGKKRQYIKINENFRFVFGAAIELKSLNIGICNLKGETITQQTFNIESEDCVDNILKIILDFFYRVLKENYINKKDILAMGICCENDNFKHLTEYLKNHLKNELNIPIYSDNIKNGLALCEFLFLFNKYEPPEKNIFIFASKKIKTVTIEQFKIYEKYKLDYCNFEKIILFKEKNKTVTIQSYYKTLKEKLATAGKKKSDINALFEDFCRCFAIAIYNARQLFNVKNVVVYGELFENATFNKYFKKAISKYTPKDIENICKHSKILKTDIYLSACAISISNAFLNLEYFEN